MKKTIEGWILAECVDSPFYMNGKNFGCIETRVSRYKQTFAWKSNPQLVRVRVTVETVDENPCSCHVVDDNVVRIDQPASVKPQVEPMLGFPSDK